MFGWFKKKSIEDHYAEHSQKDPVKMDCELFYQEWDQDKSDLGDIVDTKEMFSFDKAWKKVLIFQLPMQ